MKESLETKKDVSKSQPINDSKLRRFLLLSAIKLLKRFRPRSGRVLMLSRRFCVKYGDTPFVDLAEASTMHFVARHTSIPVPKVYYAFSRKGRTYILMERIQGKILGQGWVFRTAESQARLLTQLKGMMDSLRALPNTGQGFSSVDGGSLYDPRIHSSERFGPTTTIQDFHRNLRSGFSNHPTLPPEVQELISWQDEISYEPVFTHGDLSSLNILVKGDDIVGIVDWECAGWYPSYWEYTTASLVNPMNEFWREEIDKFLKPFPVELAMENVRRKYWGEV